MTRAALLSLFALLAACASIDAGEAPLDLRQLSGSTLTLTRALTIPGGSAGTTLQFGEPVRPSDVKSYYPHCRLEVLEVRDAPQTVLADEFHVRRAYRMEQTAARAGLLPARRLSPMNGSSIIAYRTILELRSARQPQVRWLTCQQWGDAALGQHLSLNQIRQALGPVILLSTALRTET